MEIADVEKVAPTTTDVKTESSTEKKEGDVKADSSTENLPWHKDERFKEFLKEKKQLESANSKLQKLLKDNDLEDPDDLEDLVKSGKSVKGKLSDLNAIDEIVAKAAKLDSYEAYWAEQKARQQKETEDPSERADRLERELVNERSQKQREAAGKKQMEATKAAIKGYENEVQNLIKEVGISKDQEPFVLEIFGVNNPSNDVDITDRKAIKKLVTDGVKRVEAYKQSIIAEYLAEKKGIVKTGAGSESVTNDKRPKIMLKDARKMFLERMQSGG